MRCAYLQGWLFGRPVDLAELTRALAAFDPACSTSRGRAQNWTSVSTQWDGLVDVPAG